MDRMEDNLRLRRAEFDQRIEETRVGLAERGVRIYCTEGCANCCSLAVHATAAEAVSIAGSLGDGSDASLGRYVEGLRKSLPELTGMKSYLRLHRKRLGPCPFLDSRGACGIYPVRPFSCRSLLSTRDGAWCGVDPADLHPLEKEAFRSSLDPQIVAYPTHYLAASGDLGKNAEDALMEEMLRDWRLSLSGNLPLLVWLVRTKGLDRTLSGGPQAVDVLLRRSGFAHPLLLQFQPAA